MTESTNNPKGDKIPKPSDSKITQEAQEERKEPPNTGWKGPIPSQKGGDYEKEFMEKPPYKWTSDEFVAKYDCSCWCGNVKFEFAGDPWDAKFCHCHDCQKLHGAPFQHAVIFPKTSVRMVKSESTTPSGASLDFFTTSQNKSAHYVPCKIACDNCRSPLFDEGRNTVLCYPSAFNFGPDKKMPEGFKAKMHIFYGSRSVDMIDGLPKWAGHKDNSELIPEVAQTKEEREKLRQPKF